MLRLILIALIVWGPGLPGAGPRLSAPDLISLCLQIPPVAAIGDVISHQNFF